MQRAVSLGTGYTVEHNEAQNIDHPLLNWERNMHRLFEASVKNVVMLRADQINEDQDGLFMESKGRVVKRAALTNRQMLKDLKEQGMIIDPGEVDLDAIRVLWSCGLAATRPRAETW